MNLLEKAEDKDASKFGHLNIILSLIGWIIALTIGFLPNWESIPIWTKYVLLCIIGILVLFTLILSLIPVLRIINGWIIALRIRKKQRYMLNELVILINEGRFLFDPHHTNSLKNYVDSIYGFLVKDPSIEPQLKRLAYCLSILSDWNYSLRTFMKIGFSRKTQYERIISDIVRHYRDTGDIVRELANLQIPDQYKTRIFNDQRRIVESKYTEHIGRIEKQLERLSKFNPSFHAVTFHRF